MRFRRFLRFIKNTWPVKRAKLLRNACIIKTSELFDETYYASQYHVPKFWAPIHFARTKNRMNNPSPVFCSKRYIDDYPDVNAAEVNPLVHFFRWGKSEGRIYKSNNECELYDYFFTQTLFDIQFYSETYMTSEERKMINPIEHYSKQGWEMGYLPNPEFDLETFRKMFPHHDINPVLYCLKYRIPEFFVISPLVSVKLGYHTDPYKNYIHMLRQDTLFPQMYPNAATCEKLILFFMTDIDCISGGLMSICGMYDLSRKLVDVHGCEVVATTFPRSGYLSGFSLFENDMVIFRYDQIVANFRNLKEIHIMIPEIYIGELYNYLFGVVDSYLMGIPFRHLNIMNQNIELMPEQFEIDRLQRYFNKLTQTTAHKSYTTQRERDKYGIPMHHIVPPIKKKIIVTPYEEKENLFLYSFDERPEKRAVLQSVRRAFPDMKFIEIKDIPFQEYLRLISRAKWAMSFGEGLDGYFTEPYAAGGVAFTAWNEEFFTEDYRGLPTILGSYADAVNELPALMKRLDHKREYEKVNEEVLTVWRKDYEGKRNAEAMMRDFFLGNYDFP